MDKAIQRACPNNDQLNCNVQHPTLLISKSLSPYKGARFVSQNALCARILQLVSTTTSLLLYIISEQCNSKGTSELRLKPRALQQLDPVCSNSRQHPNMTRSTLEAAISTLQVKEDPESPSSPTTSIQLRKDEIPFVYFDELDGYFYVQTLGSGEYANAHLCSSRVTGALTVRKEEKHTVDVFHREGTFKVTDIVQLFADEGRPVTRQANAPSYEVHITSRLQHIPGVVKLEGCVLHCGQPVDSNNPIPPKQGLGSTPDRGLQVSYWKYYNLGSIDNVVDKYEGFVPEYWLCSFISTMISTLIAVHAAGIAHNDIHHGIGSLTIITICLRYTLLTLVEHPRERISRTFLSLN